MSSKVQTNTFKWEKSPAPARAGEVFAACGNGKKSIILGMEKKSQKSQKKGKKGKKRKKGRKREKGGKEKKWQVVVAVIIAA